MLFKREFREYLITIVVVCYFSAANGIAIYNTEKDIKNEEKRGAVEEVKNEILLSGESSSKAKTEKRGVWETRPYNDPYEEDPPRRPGPPYYGGHDQGGYDDRYPHRYPNTGIGNSGHSGPGYYEDDHHHSSYGYPEEGHRPSGYGPTYGSGYGGGYEEEHHYQDHGGGGEGHSIGNFKTIALKKLLLPLAGLAILGVAAVASQNPVLLQLGVVNGRRKRSALPLEVYPPNPKVRPQTKLE